MYMYVESGDVIRRAILSRDIPYMYVESGDVIRRAILSRDIESTIHLIALAPAACLHHGVNDSIPFDHNLIT